MGRPKGSKNHRPSASAAPPGSNRGAAQLLARCMAGNHAQQTIGAAAIVEDSVSSQTPAGAPTPHCILRPIPKENSATNNKEWDNQLLSLGYGRLKCQVPNKAVQAVLCCFGEKSIHDFILDKEHVLTDLTLSAVAHLGFNGWLGVLARYMKHPQGVLTDIVGQYVTMFEHICSRTEKEDRVNLMGDQVIPYMEKTNNISSRTEKRKRNSIPCTPTKKQFGNSIFGAARAMIGADASNRNRAPDATTAENAKDVVRLNMFNSYFFPALSNEVVESLGKQFDHILWKCKNYGVLAPISAQSFIDMADLKQDQIDSIKAVTENGECILEKMNIELPFTTQVFDKLCHCPYGIYVNQKTHMADLKIARDDQFAMKLWRSFCPYIKCGCDKRFFRGDERLKCRDNITWFDQAIWFLLNHLDVLYPGVLINEAFMSLINLLSTALQPVALAYVGFMHFWEVLIQIAYDYALNKDCAAIFEKYGNKRMVWIALDMIKPKPKEGDQGNQNGRQISVSRDFSFNTDPKSADNYYPPRMMRSSPSAGNCSTEVSTGSVVPTCNLAENSVNKAPTTSRLEQDMEPTNLNME